MSGYGLFQTSTLGMQSQAHKLNTIGYNIANVNTGGFKRTDTEFETVLSDRFFQQSDIGGVKPYARATNDVQGLVTISNNNLDLAIVGDGFFAVQPELTGTQEIFFTRDGAFEISTVDGQTSSVTADDGSTISVSNGYLVDKNGYFLLGSPINSDGSFSSGAAAPMRVDQFAFIDQGQATTQASMEFNLPQNTEFGDDAELYTLTTYDSAGNARNVNFSFSRALDNNQWRMDFTADNLTSGTLSPGAAYALSVGGTTNRELRFNAADNSVEIVDSTTGIPVAGGFSGLAAGDDITFTDTTSNDLTFTISSINSTGTKISLGSGVTTESTGATTVSAASTASLTETLIFSSIGELQSPTDLTFAATWDDGSTSSFALSIDGMTQFDGDFTPFRTSQDGYGKASITDVGFDKSGHVVGTFSDGTERAIYKVPLYDFANANGLEALNGMLFRESEASGTAVEFFADESSKAQLQPNAHELSNVDIATEFTLMIQTQTAYNMNATTFKTIDEMTTVARDLKA